LLSAYISFKVPKAFTEVLFITILIRNRDRTIVNPCSDVNKSESTSHYLNV